MLCYIFYIVVLPAFLILKNCQSSMNTKNSNEKHKTTAMKYFCELFFFCKLINGIRTILAHAELCCIILYLGIYLLGMIVRHEYCFMQRYIILFFIQVFIFISVFLLRLSFILRHFFLIV